MKGLPDLNRGAICRTNEFENACHIVLSFGNMAVKFRSSRINSNPDQGHDFTRHRRQCRRFSMSKEE